ncbi:diacylglycerol/lipid kinase family protein [Candidatus Neomarinimicrobiota bacterium]
MPETPKRLCFVVNPFGGKKKGPAIMRQIKPVFDAAGVAVDIIETEYSRHAWSIVQGLDPKKYDGICGIGGDGTLHELVNGLLTRPDNADIPIGMVPGGSGNSFMESLKCLDPIDAAQRIIIGHTRPIDVAGVSLAGEKTVYSCNIVGWGLVTDVMIEADKYRWMGGAQYTFASAIEVMKGKTRRGKLMVDGKIIDDDYIFILGCNTPFTGRSMLMAPRAQLSDGHIDLVIVRQAPRIKVLRLLPKVFDGSHVTSPLLEYRYVKEFEFYPEVESQVNIDGELAGNTPISMKMIPHAFRLLT